MDPIAPGSILANRYAVRELLGEGAMGQVWLADDPVADEAVALKLVSGRAAGGERAVLEFLREFRLQSQLRHPNCCEVRDAGWLPGELPYLTMEVVPGRGLDQMGQLASEQLRGLLGQLLRALGYLHGRGFVHCDLKPANVRVRPDGVLKLMDFGLMDFAGRSGGPIKGTLSYIAPEVVRRASVDQRADLYALGALAYELLTGQPPFVGATPGEVLRAHLEAPVVPPSRKAEGVDPKLESIILRLLEKEATARFQSADEVLVALGLDAEGGAEGRLLASPMVGRAPAMAKLLMGLAKVMKGKGGGLSWVHGPPGVGKSRLLEEFAFNMQLEDLPWAEARCHEFAQAPYGPWLEAVRALGPKLRAEQPVAYALHAPALARLLPELGVAALPPISPPERERVRVESALIGLLLAAAKAKGAVVVLEDWQWADPASEGLLPRLLAARGEAALWLLVASRSAPPAALKPSQVLDLAPLGPKEVGRMAAAMLGQSEAPPEDSPWLQALVKASGGLPAGVALALPAWVRSGRLTREAGAWSFAEALAAEAAADGLDGLWQAAAEALGPAARRIGRVVAVVGAKVELPLLQSVAGLESEAFFAGVDELVAAGALLPVGEGTYRPGPGAWRELLGAGLSGADGRALCTAAAQAMEARHGDLAPEDWPLEALLPLVDLHLHGELPGRGAALAREAGARLVALGAAREAERVLREGLAAAEEEAEWLSGGLALALGEVLLRAGRWGEAEGFLARAAEAAEAVGDLGLGARALVARARALAELGLDEEELALASAARAADWAVQAGDQAGAARALALLGRLQLARGAFAEAEAALGMAKAGAEAIGAQGALGEALAGLGALGLAREATEPEAARALLGEAVAILDPSAERGPWMAAQTLLAEAARREGDLAGARAAHQAVHQVAQNAGESLAAAQARLQLASLAWLEGDAALAAQEAEAVGADAAAVATPALAASALHLEAAALAALGHLSEARGILALAAERGAEVGARLPRLRLLVARAEAYLELGEADRAKRNLREAQALVQETGNLEPQAELYLRLGEAALVAGEAEAAEPYLEGAAQMASLVGGRPVLARAKRGEAVAALRRGAPEAAQALARQALEVARGAGLRGVAVEAELALGEACLALGQAKEAKEAFGRALAEAEALGRPWWVGEARFGLAAAEPYGAEAAGLAVAAREAWGPFLAELTPEWAEASLAVGSRRRAWEGQHIAFSLPSARPAAAPSGPRPGGPPGGLGGFGALGGF